MKVLFAIPHFFQQCHTPRSRHASVNVSKRQRLSAVRRCLVSIHAVLGEAQCLLSLGMPHARQVNQPTKITAHVIICTTPDGHLLSDLEEYTEFCDVLMCAVNPRLLGFECHRVLADRVGEYDYYAYLEDDLVITQPDLFQRLKFLSRHLSADSILLPNRFECRSTPPLKVYIDGPLAKVHSRQYSTLALTSRATKTYVVPYLGTHIMLTCPENPHSGCFFLSEEQMKRWSSARTFLDRDTRFVGPLESAATLNLAKSFRIFKPAPVNANVLEIQHFGSRMSWRLLARNANSLVEPRGTEE
jgi:hypothetical protein